MRDVCGEHIIVATGRKNIDFSKIISMNESAALMWKSVCGKDFTIEDLVQAVCAEYEVEEAVARKDAEAIVAQWQEIGLIEGLTENDKTNG